MRDDDEIRERNAAVRKIREGPVIDRTADRDPEAVGFGSGVVGWQIYMLLASNSICSTGAPQACSSMRA
jgi:hypothetical protein